MDLKPAFTVLKPLETVKSSLPTVKDPPAPTIDKSKAYSNIAVKKPETDKAQKRYEEEDDYDYDFD